MEAQKLDYKRLINLVRERRELYDNTVPDYRNRDHIINIWIKIASELRTNVMDVKAKWQMLRCNYMREKKKVQKRLSEGGNALSATTWAYFYMLTFLDVCKDDSYKDTSNDHIMEHNSSSSFELIGADKGVNIKHEFLESDASDNGVFDVSESTPEIGGVVEGLFRKSTSKNNESSENECNIEIECSKNKIFEPLDNDRSSNVPESSGLTRTVRIEVDIKPSLKRKSVPEQNSSTKTARQIVSPEPSDCNISSVSFNDFNSANIDSDQQFFYSLLPFIKTLTPTQNLEFRSGVIHLLLSISNKQL